MNNLNLYAITITILTCAFSLASLYKVSLRLPIILLLGLFVRIIIMLVFAHSVSGDIYSFLITGNVFLQGIPIFPSVYFPFIFYLGAISLIVGPYIPPLLFLKIVFCLFDVGVIYMIYKISKSSHASILYAIHPVMIIIIAIHGQLDSLVLFFFLLSIAMFQQKNTTLSSLLLGIAISIKPWPILFLPSFLKKTTQKISYFFLACLSPAMSVLVHSFLTGVPVGDIITPVKNYRGIYGIWGIGSIINTLFPLFLEQNIRFFRRLFLVLFTVWQFINHKKTFLEELFLTLLVFFSFSPLFGAQWLSWIIPFLCMYDKRPIIKTIILTVYIGLSFLGDIVPYPFWDESVRLAIVNIIGLIVWVFLILFFLSYRKYLLNSNRKNFMSHEK